MKKSKYILSGIFAAFVFVFAILLVVLPKQDFSQNEKKVLSTFPSFSAEALFDGSWFKDIENFVSDQFPFRETFIGINSYYSLITGRNGANGVFKGSDGYLVAKPENLDINRTKINCETVNDFVTNTDISASIVLVPTPGYILEDKLPANHLPYNDDEIFRFVSENISSDVKFIDLRGVFAEKTKDGEQLYFKTDHHLNTNGSYLMYNEFCKSTGLSAISEFGAKEELKNFYGTNYSKSGLWLQKPDTVEIWHSANNYDYDVVIDDISKQEKADSLYFYKHDENMDKYPVFLNGNHALVTIKNNSVQNGKKLLVIKDSYAHCFATFLCENYEEITLIDLRYYKTGVSELAANNGITEVLFLFGAENFANMQDIAWLY